MMQKARYGVDDPQIIIAMSAIGVMILVITATLVHFIPARYHLPIRVLVITSIMAGGYCLILAALMLFGSLVGKKRLVNQLVNSLRLKGDERLLDVGCGRGILLIAAAQQLTSGGEAVGVDLWLQRYQSGNSEAATRENAQLARVDERITLVSGDMKALTFADNSFDVVVSSLAIHNIDSQEGREQTIKEMSRVLKPGGKIAILDQQYVADYRHTLLKLGWHGLRTLPRSFAMFPPVQMLTAVKTEGI
ncbi:MAG: methyltransferase domain-containing protein [Gammaproteobacteria bacterium]|nr:methyltransferase domain-containing protein [Gammaproteobacteria bacterium]